MGVVRLVHLHRCPSRTAPVLSPVLLGPEEVFFRVSACSFRVVGPVAVGLIIGGGLAAFFAFRSATSGLNFPSFPSVPSENPVAGRRRRWRERSANGHRSGGDHRGAGRAVQLMGGLQESHVIACNGGTLNVSGVQNNVTVTGHCGTLSVSGVKNVVIVDSTDNISASGVRPTRSPSTPGTRKSTRECRR